MNGLWYVLGFAGAGVSFVFLTIGIAWLISHRTRGSRGKQVPYESGIDTYGDTHGRFGLSFYLYALLFVAFDVEIVFIYIWALNFQSLLIEGLVSMAVFIGVLLIDRYTEHALDNRQSARVRWTTARRTSEP